MTRVLLSAYQCGPGMGSVSQIGWEWYARMAVQAKVTLVTHVRNKPAMERAGAPLANSDIVYIDTEYFAGPLFRIAKRLFPLSEHAVFLLSSADYFLFDHLAKKRVRRRALAAEWQVVHQVTPVSPLAATTLHSLKLPLVLGPWNGGLKSPRQFPDLLRLDSGWVYGLRQLGRLVNVLRRSTKQAAAIFSANTATDRAIPAGDRDRVIRLIENGVDPERFQGTPSPPPPSNHNPVRLLFVGRLIPFKALNFLIDAAARVKKHQPVELTVIGDGPMRAEWEAEAQKKLSHSVRFLGNCPIDEVALHLQACHVLCLPSVRESGGAVVLEAMSAGRPVIAVAYGGPAETVDESVGRAIPSAGSTAIIDGFEKAILNLARNPEAWCQKGVNGRSRAAQQFSWAAKIEYALKTYQHLIQEQCLRAAS